MGDTRRDAERLAASAGRWWRRHQDQYLIDLANVQDDPGRPAAARLAAAEEARVSRAVDVGATVGADGVAIKLPRLRVVVERRQAERLRDALGAVLPERIDLEHDPRVSDLQVLRAARSLLGERQARTPRT